VYGTNNIRYNDSYYGSGYYGPSSSYYSYDDDRYYSGYYTDGYYVGSSQPIYAGYSSGYGYVYTDYNDDYYDDYYYNDDNYRSGDVDVLSSRSYRSNPEGELAGLSSVYLNQVPYTGPEDTMKIIGFVSLLTTWSGAIAFYFMKVMQKKNMSNNILAFKLANKNKLGL
jgi:hypothetical protein